MSTPVDQVSRSTVLSVANADRARRSIPRGMVSGARGYADLSMTRAVGSSIEDVDGNVYVDTVAALGPMFHGGSPAPVRRAVQASLERGLQFSAPSTGEVELAERVLGLLPWADKVLYANTGTEAVQHALRIARGTTGRAVVVKFEGHYHGWIDPVYVNPPGSGPAPAAEHGLRVSHTNAVLPVPANVVVSPWGDLSAFERIMDEIGDQVAAVIVEPAVSSFGCYLPAPGLLEGIRASAHRHGALVIVDEVVTGFRFARDGLCGQLGFVPDLAVYAKAVASGLPLALVAGSDVAMSSVLEGKVTVGGTYNATPVAVAAADAVLTMNEEDPNLFDRVAARAARLADGLREAAADAGVPATINQVASLVQPLIGSTDIAGSPAGVLSSDPATLMSITRRMLDHGVYILPRGLMFLSTAHDDSDVDTIVRAFHASAREHVAQQA